MPHLLLTGNILKDKTPLERAASKVIKSMLFTSDRDTRDIQSRLVQVVERRAQHRT